LRFARGSDYPVFDLGFAKVGLQICYEAGIPEGARLLTLKGATVVVYSAAFSGRRSYAWELGTQARALENGVFVLAGNRCGKEGEEYPFAGRSRIVAPNGSILKEAQSGEQALCCEIDLAAVEAQRMEIPYLRDYDLPLMARQLNSLME
jgi:predicted amidohydrolase